MNHYVILVMNISTPAIVLHCSRLTDKTSVLHLFTRESGRVAYYLYGATSKRNMRNALLMPLALLDIEAVHQENREIQQLKEWRLAYVANATADDIRRQSVAMLPNTRASVARLRTLRPAHRDNPCAQYT